MAKLHITHFTHVTHYFSAFSFHILPSALCNSAIYRQCVFNYYSQILVKPTWKNPIADVVVFVVENPPASVIRLADEIRRVFVPVEANLPQAGAVEITVLRISGDPPGTGSEADKT